MATVIAFPKQQGRTRDRLESQGPATIIMFSGVRIERLDDENIATRATPRRIYANNSQATAEELEA